MVSRVSPSRNGILRLNENARHRNGVDTGQLSGLPAKSSEASGEPDINEDTDLELNAALKCSSRKKGRYAPQGHMTKLTAQREIMPWHLPDSSAQGRRLG